MALSKGRDRRREFESLSEGVTQDFDPEGDLSPADDNDSTDNDSADEAAGREHYAPVPKSELRKPKNVALGPQYRGSKVSRKAMLDDEDEDDPFSRDFGSDDASEELDIDEDEEEASDISEEENNSETEDTEISDDEEASQSAHIQPTSIDYAETRRELVSGQSSVAASLAAAHKTDAERGRAILQQRATFDALLNTRIKLQKALISSNSLVALETSAVAELREQTDAVQKAESAALNLWTTLTQYRQHLDDAKTGDKRKKYTATASTPLSGLMRQLTAQEENTISLRNAILQKWSMKSRSVSATSGPKLNNEQPATIVDVLNQHLSSSERLLKKARTPRSCAPVQLSNRVNEDEHIYDDADFYGLLLKELLEAKSSAASATANNVDLSNLTSMRREAKTRKNVDTRASKGRKLRYTVHEKLQNYCAPEDRTSWGERQVDELFSSLFGQSIGLNEEKQTEDDDEMNIDGQELLLFKS